MKRRMTDLDIQMVVEEIDAWGRFERGRKLSWSVLEKIFPFTRQTMYSKEPIVVAFKSAKEALSTGKASSVTQKAFVKDDLKLQRLRKRIKELEIQIEGFQELWVRYEFNALRHGIDPEILRKGLPAKPQRH